MAERDSSCLASIVYYFTEKYYRQTILTTAEHLKMYNADPVLLFFKAHGILMEGRVQEAIRELEQLRDKPDVSLCSIMALIYAHRQSETVDRDAVEELDSQLKLSRKTAGDKALYYAAMFLWLMGRSDKAKDYIDRMLKMSSSSKEGLILKGWIELSSEVDQNRNKAIRYFESGLQDSKSVFGLMGKVKYFMKKQNFSGALEEVNQIISFQPDFLPALTSKMNLFLAQQDWEQTLDAASRCLKQDGRNLKALQIMVIHAIVKDGDLIKAQEHLQALLGALESTEPCAPGLHVSFTKPISRLCGNHTEILQTLCQFVERAFAKAPADADIANEIGYLFVLQNKIKEAARWYSNGIKLDGSSVTALAGVIHCQLLQGQLEEADQQLEFLREIQQSIGLSVELAFIQAMLACKRGESQAVVSALLKEAAELHFSAIRGLPLGVEYYEKLNPTFLFEVVKTNLAVCQPRALGQPLSFGLMHSAMILDPVVRTAPGILPGAYLMAKVKYLSGDFTSAQVSVTRCLELDPTVADVHLLQAQICLSVEDFKKCLQSLETGVSHNFQVRELPQYHLIKARVLKKMGNIPEAIQTLKMVMSLPGLRREAKGRETSISNSDRVSAYLELAEALRLNGEQHEATKVMQDAIVNFTGTPEEILVTLANVDLALAKDDSDTALTVLRNITPDQQHYTEAKEKIAKIYLEKRKDKKLYIACYRELCEDVPGPHSSVLLGDAYMKIEEPEKAIDVYQAALKKSSRDATLARKIGQAFVKTHQYNQAVSYYEAALKISGQDFLRNDLAELLLKMRQYEKATKILNQALDHEPGNDLLTMMNDVKYLLLLAKIDKRCGSPSMETLEKAYNIQMRVMRRLPLEQPEAFQEQKTVAASICHQIGQLWRSQRDFDRAKKSYKEALSFCDGDQKVILELAHLRLEQGNMESCYQQCQVLLKNQDSNEEAAMLMADLLFRRKEYDGAVSQFTKLMEQTPDNYFVLAKFINLLRRTGKLDDAPAHFERCEKHSPRATMEPGYNFCKGLYCWHMGQVNEALMHFNKARRDTDWSEGAVHHMIEICLNPDSDTVGGEVFEAVQEEWRRESEPLGVSTAQNLLKEYHPRTREGEEKALLLYNRCLMATKEPKQVERALSAFTEMASSLENNVPYLLAMAQAFMILKQAPRARNQLKRLSKTDWSESNAEDLEKSWILLADVYIKSGKYDIAVELLKRCLLYNKSCSKAFEYLGFMMENEQSYKDAIGYYEQAWKYTNRVNPAMGFRLAFNYLKYKKYTEAIDVCRKVLTEHPGYPLIQREILERAWLALRP
ncbi:tetratricopeptide repeat protein 21B-like [Anguilla anguilla]|uniref:tetratricopeptide repeat protein 21B-like n=1 Tax=Anguilla anguilla TaxID=7936 RepID=UPI0015AD85A9|nr:tetratricopeptide repeat protein 21B-like [Anguilla anguilla]